MPTTLPVRAPSGPVMKIPSRGPLPLVGSSNIGPKNPRLKPARPVTEPYLSARCITHAVNYAEPDQSILFRKGRTRLMSPA